MTQVKLGPQRCDSPRHLLMAMVPHTATAETYHTSSLSSSSSAQMESLQQEPDANEVRPMRDEHAQCRWTVGGSRPQITCQRVHGGCCKDIYHVLECKNMLAIASGEPFSILATSAHLKPATRREPGSQASDDSNIRPWDHMVGHAWDDKGLV